MSDSRSDASAAPAPTTGRGWYEAGKEKQRAGDLAGALDAFRRSLKLNPHAAAAWIGLGEVLDANQQPRDGLECYRRGVAAEPKSAVAATRLARALQALGMVEGARRAYDQALALDPTSRSARLGLGELCEDQGDPQAAADAYRGVLARYPDHGEALANLLGLGRSVDISDEIALAEQRMAAAEDRDRALIGYGLGKALDRLQRYDEAFTVLTAANAARRSLAGPFVPDAFETRVQRLTEIFSAEFFHGRTGWGAAATAPVFIVGLPRSGTTLTEQILGAHPACFGAGELGVLADLATGTPDRLGRAEPPWPENAPDLSDAQAQALGNDYAAQVTRLAPPGAVRIIDKQPLNFWQLGLVAIALPHAKIIHCTRDIRDNGFSIYSQNFNVHQRWSTDLEDIATYWRGYRRLMAHWGEVTSLQMIEAPYEAMVQDPERQARRLLDFLELPWDPSVLAFHESSRAVQTPSRWQVRQPIYTSSKARWQHYETHLAPLIAAACEAEGQTLVGRSVNKVTLSE
ncbi:MAG: sulfotransferase [Pseudomonadota bacterium]